MRVDWVETTLEYVAKWGSGGTPRSGNSEYYNGKIPWLIIADLNDGIISNSQKKITNAGLKNSSSKLVKPDSVLIAMYGSIGKLGINSIELATNQAIAFTQKLYPNTNNKYLFYYLFSSRTKLYKLGKGATQQNISQTVLKKFKIPLSPLPEQRAIVNKIETLFKDLDSGINHLKIVQTQLKTYRQAVLKKAFELKADKVPMGKIAKWGSGGTPLRSNSDFYINGTIPWLKTGELGNKFVSFANEKITELAIKKSSTKIFPKGSVAIAMYGATIGKTSIFKFDFATNQACAVAKPLDNIDKEYLYYYLLSQKQDFIRLGKGGAQPNISQGILKEYLIPLPKIKKQTQIVKEIETRLGACDETEKLITESLTKAEHLRQSILKKAFEGKLLSDIELAECKKAKDYLPAKELLKQIKAEKLPAVKSKKIIKKPKAPVKKISADIHAGLISKVILLHEKNPKYTHNLTHIKCEKMAHLVETHLQIPLGRKPVKDAAGPDDYPHLKKVEHRAKMVNYFTKVKQKIGYRYQSGNNLNKAIDKFDNALSDDKKSQVNKLLKLFLNFDLESSEIVATLYAGWNNLLIDGKTPSDDEIVLESRENWSSRKLTIDKDRFYQALEWMRRDNIALIPTGYGIKVVKNDQ